MFGRLDLSCVSGFYSDHGSLQRRTSRQTVKDFIVQLSPEMRNVLGHLALQNAHIKVLKVYDGRGNDEWIDELNELKQLKEIMLVDDTQWLCFTKTNRERASCMLYDGNPMLEYKGFRIRSVEKLESAVPYDAACYYAGRRVKSRFTLGGEVFEGDWVRFEEVLRGIGERYKGWKVPQVRRGVLGLVWFRKMCNVHEIMKSSMCSCPSRRVRLGAVLGWFKDIL